MEPYEYRLPQAAVSAGLRASQSTLAGYHAHQMERTGIRETAASARELELHPGPCRDARIERSLLVWFCPFCAPLGAL